MPCNTDYMREPPATDEQHKAILADRDRLTAENDQLREVILDAVNHGALVPGEGNVILTRTLYTQITGRQVEHRTEDLARLARDLTAAAQAFEPIAYATGAALVNGRQYRRDALLRMLGAVVAADPTKPLQPQLGFDPDDI